MKLVTQVKATPACSEDLLVLIRHFNACCSWLSTIAFDEKLWHWLPLQRRAYREVRDRFGLTAAATLVAIRKVAHSYSNKARRDKQAVFKPLGAIPLYKHSYRGDGTAYFYGHRMPYQTRPGVVLPKNPPEATLCYQDSRFYIHQPIEVEEPSPYEPQGFLGCDLGIVNILVDSDGGTYSGSHLNSLRHRHARLRAKLQAKGTKSAKRLLRKRRRKESRFARDVNHCISKRVVAKAIRHRLGIALEDLQGIRERTTVRKAQRRQHHSWAFAQLRDFITYKATVAGVPVTLVDPRNTSRTCPACEHVAKANRRSQSEFLCVDCGFAGLADYVAAVNIHRRAAGDRPYAVAPSGVGCESREGLLALKG